MFNVAEFMENENGDVRIWPVEGGEILILKDESGVHVAFKRGMSNELIEAMQLAMGKVAAL